MTQTTEVQYRALKPLTLTLRGERLQLAPGDIVPAETHGRWLGTSLEAGKIAASPSLGVFTDVELRNELVARGYKITKAK